MKEIKMPTINQLPLPAKMLATAIIASMSIAMLGALAQIYVHDIVPTFYGENNLAETGGGHMHGNGHMSEPELQSAGAGGRGDLFAGDAPTNQATPHQSFLDNEQFVWALKWTHIHLFGMSMIFIFMGAITLFLGLNARVRAWLIILPFVGIIIDIASVWLKIYVSPKFFWMHIPGGGTFSLIFAFVSVRALYEMWIKQEI